MYDTFQLENGITVIAEKIDYVHSVSIGIFVYHGSRHEDEECAGASHFIEHMLFKGTQNRSAKKIAEEFDSIGGHLNAYTTKEYTCYYAKVLNTHMDMAADVLSDMLLHSNLNPNDLNLERHVIEEEIHMTQDVPEELVHDMMLEAAWGSQAGLGSSILGSEETLEKMDSDFLRSYMDQYYTPGNMVISAVGNFNVGELRCLLQKKFGEWDRKGEPVLVPIQTFGRNTIVEYRDNEQTQLCLGFEGPAAESDEMYTAMVFNNVLGNGASSRLFQRIREEKGLVYSIYSYLSTFIDTGIFVISAGMVPENIEVVCGIIYEELNRAKREILDEKLLYRAKEQLKGNYILGLENISSRMQSIGRAVTLFGEAQLPEQIISRIDRVSAEAVHHFVSTTFDYDKMAVSAIGHIQSKEVKALRPE